jgi:hypothetical protein
MFFWTEYHLGKINVILHLVSFSLMFCGLAVKSAPVVLIGLFVFDGMENAYITSLCINGTLDSVSELSLVGFKFRGVAGLAVTYGRILIEADRWFSLSSLFSYLYAALFLLEPKIVKPMCPAVHL